MLSDTMVVSDGQGKDEEYERESAGPGDRGGKGKAIEWASATRAEAGKHVRKP